MLELDQEYLKLVKEAASAEELVAKARELGLTDLDEEDIRACFDRYHKMGELSDEELDNVSGGGCYSKSGELKTTYGYRCGLYEKRPDATASNSYLGVCHSCQYWKRPSNDLLVGFGQPGICQHPNNRK